MTDLLELTAEYVSAVVDELGSDLKAMLLDSTAMSAVSVACPQSTLMARGVYLFHKLEDSAQRSGGRTERLDYVSCLCLCAPSRTNADLLRAELSRPAFGKYHLVFTDKIDRSLLKELAEADSGEVVASVSEIPLAFRALHAHLYLASTPDEDCPRGVISLLQGCHLRPKICYAKSSWRCRAAAVALARANFDDATRPATVLFFDRRLDPITPLLNQWTYQAMIHEAFGIRNSVVALRAGTVPAELETVALSERSDQFYANNMYADFGAIGETIRKLVADYQTSVADHQKIESIGDIKDFITSYPDFRKMSGTVTRHVNLVSEISKFVTSNKLLDLSECEQTLSMCGREEGNLKEVLTTKGIRALDVKRLICLLYLKRGLKLAMDCEEVNIACRHPEVRRSDLDTLLYNLREFTLTDAIAPSVQNDRQQLLGSTRKSLFGGLRGIENVFTQHRPILKDIVSSILRRKAHPGLNFADDFEFVDTVVVHVAGGVTYEEAKTVRDLNKEFAGANVVLGGDQIWRSEDFLGYLSKK